MADPTWGLLGKSLVDNETIEGAINRLITAHEADPTAHLGVGESLEAHKSDTVVDHPAGSVLADKWTMSEMDFSTTFESLAGFYTSGDVSQLWPGAMLDVNVSLGHLLALLVVDLESAGLYFDTSKPSLIQFPYLVDAGDHGILHVYFGNANSASPLGGMGIEITKTLTRFYVAKSDGSSPSYLNFAGHADYTNHIVRIQNDPDNGVVKCYIDGVLIGELAWPEQWVEFGTIKIKLEGSVSGGAVANVRSLYFSMSI